MVCQLTKMGRTSARTRATNNSLGHRAKKRFGQNFLSNVSVLDALLESIAPQPQQAMVEVGPGLGALTHPLLQRVGFLLLIELDRDLAKRWAQQANTQLVQADVLKVDFAEIAQRFAPRKLRLVGNLPYNISSPLLFHLLPWAELVQDQHFMLQKEVVERMVARPDSAAYGRMSVVLQWRYAMELLHIIPPHAFEPAPKVESAFVRMLPKPQPAQVAVKRLEELVKVAFSQRRKMIKNTLGYWLEAQGFSGDFDLGRRAQEVSVDEFVFLAQSLERGE